MRVHNHPSGRIREELAVECHELILHFTVPAADILYLALEAPSVKFIAVMTVANLWVIFLEEQKQGLLLVEVKLQDCGKRHAYSPRQVVARETSSTGPNCSAIKRAISTGTVNFDESLFGGLGGLYNLAHLSGPRRRDDKREYAIFYE